MSHSNSTTNYNLPQFVGTDTPGWLTDVNSAFADIDTQIHNRETAIATNANDIISLAGRMTTAEAGIVSLDADINAPSVGLDARMTAAETNISDNTNNITTNTTAIGNLSTTVTGISAKMPVIVTITLNAVDWDGVTGEYSIADAAVKATSIIFIGLAENPTNAMIDDWNNASIVPGAVTAGTGFTIKAYGTIPSNDIDAVYVRMEG